MDNNHFEALFGELEKALESAAKASLTDYLAQAETDGKQALQNAKANLQRWAGEVESGAMTKEDLAFLLQGETALEELTALKQAGLATVRLEQFRNTVINTIISTLFSVVKI